MATKFETFAPRIMRDLMKEPHFGFGLYDVAAIVGNFGHETGGFEHWQEINPTVQGSRGGWGWAQWTGPRRREFEAYAKRRGFAPTSYEANYAFLIRELLTTEKRAVPAIKAKISLDEKVEAFEDVYERSGVKAYASRKIWARRALEAYRKTEGVAPVPKPYKTYPKGVVEAAQKDLARLGYNPGYIDDKMGPKTEAALIVFQRAEGLPPTGEPDSATLERLKIGIPAPVNADRENATLDDLRKKDSEQIKQSDGAKNVAAGTGLVALIATVFSGLAEAFGTQWLALQQMRAAFSFVPGWVWAFGVLVACLVILWRVNASQMARLRAEQRGQMTSIPLAKLRE